LVHHQVAPALAARRPRLRAVHVVMALPAVRPQVRHAAGQPVRQLPGVDVAAADRS